MQKFILNTVTFNGGPLDSLKLSVENGQRIVVSIEVSIDSIVIKHIYEVQLDSLNAIYKGN